jgi:hypothetical protein
MPSETFPIDLDRCRLCAWTGYHAPVFAGIAKAITALADAG